MSSFIAAFGRQQLQGLESLQRDLGRRRRTPVAEPVARRTAPVAAKGRPTAMRHTEPVPSR